MRRKIDLMTQPRPIFRQTALIEETGLILEWSVVVQIQSNTGIDPDNEIIARGIMSERLYFLGVRGNVIMLKAWNM